MKLLIYSHAFAPQIGGVETYAMHLARGLAARGEGKAVQVTVVTQSDKKTFDDSAMPFAIVRRPGIGKLRKLIRESDVVHLAGPVMAPMILAMLARKPVVVEHHGYQASCPNGLLLYQPTKTACPNHYMRGEYSACLKCNAAESGWLTSMKMLMLTAPRRWLCRRADVNLCISQHVAGRLELPRSMVVYYGVPQPCENSELNEKVSSGSTVISQVAGVADQSVKPTLSIAYVGRLVLEKDVPTIVEAVRLAQKSGYRVALKIIGDGPDRARVEAAIGAHTFDPPITMTGYLLGDALSDALGDAAVVVIPTIMEETAGLAVMEQLGRGKPVIVSDIGGLAEVAGDGGLKFTPGNAAALAACLQRLVDEPNLLHELGARAKKRALAVFSLDRMIEEHFLMFENLSTGAAR
jgi:glycosyltransferase involved in cell wall biosynthesis